MALVNAVEHLQSQGRWDDDPFSFEKQSVDNRKFILDLLVGFKSVWYSGSVWPAFTAVLLQF